MESIEKIYKEISDSNLRIWPDRAETLLEKLKYLTDFYILLGDAEKERFRSQVPNIVREKLFALGGAAAEKCLNSDDVEWVKVGVLAYMIGDFYDDPRDNVRAIVLFDYAARFCETTFRAVCIPLMPEASETGRETLESFLSRDAADNSLESMGVVEILKDGKRKLVPLPRTTLMNTSAT